MTKLKRDVGNGLYNARRFKDALRCYTEAVSEGDTLAEGNRAAALFELGRYKESFEAAQAAAESAAADGDASRASRMHQRAARAALLEGRLAEAAEAAAAVRGGGAAGSRLLQCAKRAMAAGEAPRVDAQALLRPAPCPTALEYYAFGHGPPESLLKGPLRIRGSEAWGVANRDHADPEELDRAEERRAELGPDVEALLEGGKSASFFLGGAGDGRHAMATILDFARLPSVAARLGEGAEGGKTAARAPGLQIVLNDIKVESVARNVVVFALLHRVGGHHGLEAYAPPMLVSWRDSRALGGAWRRIEAARERAGADESFSEALEDLTLLAHVFCSPFLLPPHYEKLKALVAELAAAPAPPFPWLDATPADWAALRETFAFWADHDFDGRLLDALVDEYKDGGEDAIQDAMLEDMNSRQTNGMLEAVQAMPDEAIEDLLHRMPDVKARARREGVTSPALKRAMVVEALREDFASEETQKDLKFQTMDLAGMYTFFELGTTADDKLLLPPVELWARYRDYLNLDLPPHRSARGNKGTGKPPHTKALRKSGGWGYEPSVEDVLAWVGGARPADTPTSWSWKGNFTVVSQDYVEERRPGKLSAKAATGMRHCNDIFRLLRDFADYERTKEEEEEESYAAFQAGGPMYKVRSLFDHVRPFLVKAARALRQLSDAGNVEIRVVPGDMHEAALRFRERGERFSGIHLSNVPDYTGLLNAMVAFGPLLRRPPKGAAAPWSQELGPADPAGSYIRSEVLLNNGIFSSLEAVCQSALHLPSMDAHGAALGLRYAGGQLWGGMTYWQPCEPFNALRRELGAEPQPPPGAPSDEASLHAWLIRLLLAIALPAHRSPDALQVENSMQTVATWCGLLDRLCDVGWPRHWIARLLESIDANKVHSCEAPPEDSPCPWRPFKPTSDAAKLDLSPILPDVRAGCSMFPQLRFLAGNVSPAAWYVWPTKECTREAGPLGGMFSNFFPAHLMAMGNPNRGVLGLFTLPGGAEAAETKIRKICRKSDSLPRELDDLAAIGARLLSMVRYDSEQRRLSVLMTPEEQKQLAQDDHVGFLVRTDSWMTLGVLGMGCFPFSSMKKM